MAPVLDPTAPGDLSAEGRKLWARIWSAGVAWVAGTDITTVELACRLADIADLAGRRYEATTDPKDLRAVIQAIGKLNDVLGTLGFTPSARARLGVAEVTVASKLDALRRKQR